MFKQRSFLALMVLFGAAASIAPWQAQTRDNRPDVYSTVCSCYCSNGSGVRMEEVITLGGCAVGITGKACRTTSGGRLGAFEGCKQCLMKGNGPLEQCLEVGGSALQRPPADRPKWRPRPRPESSKPSNTAPVSPN